MNNIPKRSDFFILCCLCNFTLSKMCIEINSSDVSKKAGRTVANEIVAHNELDNFKDEVFSEIVAKLREEGYSEPRQMFIRKKL